MKTSLLILISFLTITAHSQNNLFFDEVKLIRLSTQTSVTVPSGKVWKIVGSDLEGENQSVNININGEPFFLSAGNVGVNNQIWLPEGTVVKRGTISGSSSAISVIQYAVIPISSSTTGSTASTGGFTSTTDFVGSGQYTTTKDYTEADSFTDIDGNEYGAVNIDGAIWSTSNLKVTKFSDGTPLTIVSTISELRNLKVAACYIDNEGGIYDGRVVYNFWAITGDHDSETSTPRKNLAPDGYKVTSLQDWKRLIDYYGGPDYAGPYLLSKNWYFFEGLDKAGLDLDRNQYLKQSLISAGDTFYEGETAFGTKSYYSIISGQPTYYIIDFQSYGNTIKYRAGVSSGDVSRNFNEACEVRVVKVN